MERQYTLYLPRSPEGQVSRPSQQHGGVDECDKEREDGRGVTYAPA